MKTIFTSILALILLISFSIAQDTMYIYKSGAVISKQAVSEVDSIILYKASTNPQGNTVTDASGNVYSPVTIGTQT